MNLVDRDLEALLATASDDQGRPLSFGIDDVVRRGRRRTTIRRATTAATAAVAAGALVTATVVWVSGTGAEQTDAPVAEQAKAVASLPVIDDNTWTRLGTETWFRIAQGQPGQNGLGVAGVHAIITDRPHEYNGTGSSAGRAIMQQDRDRGFVAPMTYGDQKHLRQFAMLRGDIRSAVFTTTTDGHTIRTNATIYQLATLPGWVLAVGQPEPRPTGDNLARQTTFDAYDADSNRVLHCALPGSAPYCSR